MLAVDVVVAAVVLSANNTVCHSTVSLEFLHSNSMGKLETTILFAVVGCIPHRCSCWKNILHRNDPKLSCGQKMEEEKEFLPGLPHSNVLAE